MAVSAEISAPTARYVWEDVIDEQDAEVYAEVGYGVPGGGGRRPALLVVDATYGFVGEPSKTLRESMQRFPTSCGESGWNALEHIETLLETFRTMGLPVLYTKSMDDRNTITRGAWGWKKDSSVERKPLDPETNKIPSEIMPLAGETVIQKTKPSGFFGTPLASYLVHLEVDTLVITGGTTSGCVRATVLDAFSHNFKSLVVQEGVFDRGALSHKVNLFDMNSKYADVVTIEQVLDYLHGLQAMGPHSGEGHEQLQSARER